MIKHIVLFKLRDDIDATTKSEKLSSFKEQLMNLMGVVPSLKSMEVGINVNPAEKYDLSLISTFDDLAGLEAYATDPRHVAVGKQIREVLDSRACNDFEF